MDNISIQRVCIWCGPALFVFFFGGFVIAGILPPLNPESSGEELRTFFVEDQTRVRVGLLITLIGSGLIAPFIAAISVQIKRIEGRYSPLAYAQLALGVIIMILLMIPMTQLMTAAFRADRDPSSVQLVSDEAFLLFVGFTWGVLVQYACIGLAVLSDRSDEPILPRWYGYLCFWCSLGNFAAAGVYLVKDGPLAWNDVVGFWLPAAAFGIWLWATVFVLLRAVTCQAAGGQDRLQLSDAELGRLADLIEQRTAGSMR